MKKILITGASGFVGKHLLDFLLTASDSEIFATYFSSSPSFNSKVDALKVDLTNKEETNQLIGELKPDQIYHLAAFSSAKESFVKPKETLENNIFSELNLLESIKENNLLETKILIVSSAEVYGLVKKEDVPIDEETPFCPTNPYAVSKITQDLLGLQYYKAHNLKTIRVRPFNHVGPGQSGDFVIASFAKKITEIEKGQKEPVMKVGNLESVRDFTDVRDVVKAYGFLMEKGKVGEVYNVGSGTGYKISEILEKMLAISSKKIQIESDSGLFRKFDDPVLICDNTKIKQEIGWSPEILIEQTLKDTLDYWRDLI